MRSRKNDDKKIAAAIGASSANIRRPFACRDCRPRCMRHRPADARIGAWLVHLGRKEEAPALRPAGAAAPGGTAASSSIAGGDGRRLAKGQTDLRFAAAFLPRSLTTSKLSFWPSARLDM